MINYCCSRCGEKVPVNSSYRVDVTDSDSIEMLKQRKSYILCLACSVELESWMEEDEKEENKSSSIGHKEKIKLNHPAANLIRWKRRKIMKHLYEKLEEILGNDLPMFLSDDRNLDLVKEVYSFGFKQGAEVARNTAKDTINEYISKMKEERNEQTTQ